MEFYWLMIIITLFCMEFASGLSHIILGILLILEIIMIFADAFMPRE